MVTPLQAHIIETLNVKKTIDPETELRARIDFAKEYLLNSGARGLTLGISGGQDSCLAGKIAQLAISELRESTGDPSYKFLALLLPYGEQRDFEDALLAVEFIQPDEVMNFNIKESVDAFENTFNRTSRTADGVPDILRDFNKGVLKSIVRMATQYTFGGQNGLLVLGTDHAAEAAVGYMSKTGDNCADLLPLSGLNKRQGKALLRLLKAPEVFMSKAPTADLLDANPGQADEMELGIKYQSLDDYLEGLDVAPEVSDRIEQRFLMTEHKRHVPITMYDTWVEEHNELAKKSVA